MQKNHCLSTSILSTLQDCSRIYSTLRVLSEIKDPKYTIPKSFVGDTFHALSLQVLDLQQQIGKCLDESSEYQLIENHNESA